MDTNSLLNLSVSQLNKAAALKERIEGLNAELLSLLGGGTSEPGNGIGRGGRRQMSVEGRKRIGEAAKERWAKIRAAKGGVPSATASVAQEPRKKRTMSPAARRKIAAAQKARWAKFHAEKKG